METRIDQSPFRYAQVADALAVIGYFGDSDTVKQVLDEYHQAAAARIRDGSRETRPRPPAARKAAVPAREQSGAGQSRHPARVYLRGVQFYVLS